MSELTISEIAQIATETARAQSASLEKQLAEVRADRDRLAAQIEQLRLDLAASRLAGARVAAHLQHVAEHAASIVATARETCREQHRSSLNPPSTAELRMSIAETWLLSGACPCPKNSAVALVGAEAERTVHPRLRSVTTHAGPCNEAGCETHERYAAATDEHGRQGIEDSNAH